MYTFHSQMSIFYLNYLLLFVVVITVAVTDPANQHHLTYQIIWEWKTKISASPGRRVQVYSFNARHMINTYILSSQFIIILYGNFKSLIIRTLHTKFAAFGMNSTHVRTFVLSIKSSVLHSHNTVATILPFLIIYYYHFAFSSMYNESQHN